MIESCYWKTDLIEQANKMKPVKTPPRWSEKLLVNFEKEIIISFFAIRKLIESHKFSSKTLQYKLNIFRAPCRVPKVHELNWWDIEETYNLEEEESISKGVVFICNQFIHGGVMYAYRDNTRNWAGIYTCSDYEKEKYIYNIPIKEIVKLFKIAGNDYPSTIQYTRNKDGRFDVYAG